MVKVGLVFIILFSVSAISIACGIHGVHTQSDVDNLKCIAVTNSITIEPNSSSPGDPIYNLDTLVSILSIGTNLIIRNNPELTDISGLRNLGSIGLDLIIENNPKLNMCCALDNLINNGTIGRSVIIQNNGGGDCENQGINITACRVIPLFSFWTFTILFMLMIITGCIILTDDIRPLKITLRNLLFINHR